MAPWSNLSVLCVLIGNAKLSLLLKSSLFPASEKGLVPWLLLSCGNSLIGNTGARFGCAVVSALAGCS